MLQFLSGGRARPLGVVVIFLEKRNCDDLEKYIYLGNCQLLSAALLLSV